MDSESSEPSSQDPAKFSTSGAAERQPSSSPAYAELSTIASDSKPPAKITNDEHPTTVTSTRSPANGPDIVPCPPDGSPRISQQSLFSSGLSAFARNLKLPQQDLQAGNAETSAFVRFTTGLGLHLPSKAPAADETEASLGGAIESFTRGLVDSSRSAVKAMQVKARHIVSQNKRRYQEGGFDLDMTYITENIIAMGFPAGDLSSGLFGFFEGFYRNHMEEVIKFFETHHEGKYKVYNLCSERLYDASRFEGKVASFPFEDHNCPPLQLIPSFCRSAYSWLKEDIQNVVVVHCKAGMARTGLMICCLLLFLKFFPTAEEAVDYYNQKRCLDGKALVLPSQIRYVKYYERILKQFSGEVPPGRRCMLRGFRLINCPYWVRPSITISSHSGVIFSTRKHPKTKDLMPQDFWIKAPRKGIIVFALPGEPGLAKLKGDFKVHFGELRGDFYCWLNTTMIENRIILSGAELDGFDKRNLPCPGFQVEIVMVDYSSPSPSKPESESSETSSSNPSGNPAETQKPKASQNEDNDDVFSDSDKEESGNSNAKLSQIASGNHGASASTAEHGGTMTRKIGDLSLGCESPKANEPSRNQTTTPLSGAGIPHLDSAGESNIKAIAADASVFSFGDDEDYESE